MLNFKNMESPINLVSDTIRKEDLYELAKWLVKDETPILTKNKLTSKLEEKWALQLGTKYSVYVNSGSSAILLTLAALLQSGRLRNSKIIVPGLSWGTDLSSPILLGMNPTLCDCNLNDLSCDLHHLEELFIKEKPSILLLVSPLGLVPDMESIVELCKKYDVVLLEDVCESMGSKFNGKNLGTFGLASFFSMYYGHHLSTIEGGFINTNDRNLYELLLMMRSHGWSRDLTQERQKELETKYNLTSFDSLFTFFIPGFNLRSTDLQAFIGLRVLERLDQVVKVRESNFKYYLNTVKGNMLNLSLNKDRLVSNFAFPVVHKERDRIVKDLNDSNIQVRPLIAGNVGKMPMWFERFGKVDLSNCDLIHNKGFYLPNHPMIGNKEIDRIVSVINKYS